MKLEQHIALSFREVVAAGHSVTGAALVMHMIVEKVAKRIELEAEPHKGAAPASDNEGKGNG